MGKELEIVREYKYLGFWFTTGNSYATHIRKMTAKVNKAINSVWGIWKRGGVRVLEDRLYLMDAIVKAGCFYGVEIWGWSTWEEIERVQGRYVKMALGLNRNTPSYIWEMEAGRDRFEIDSLKRAGKYLLDIERMGEERWPRVCWREELRGLKNSRATKWGLTVKKALEATGDGESINKFLIEGERRRLGESLQRGVRVKRDQGLQRNWCRIDKSSYCGGYRDWKKDPGREKYWGRNVWKGETKEQWARLRCGNLGREKSKGFKEVLCRLCGREEENVEHIWGCERAREFMEEDWVRVVEEKGLAEGGERAREALIKMLRGDPIEEVCMFSRKFEEIARKKQREEVKETSQESDR